MNTGLAVSIALGLLAVGVPLATFFAATHANRQQARAELVKAEADAKGVDALAYDRASKILQELITDLREEVDRLREAKDKLENEVGNLRDSNTKLITEVVNLRQANANLAAEVVSLRAEIEALLHTRKGDK